MKIDDIQSIGKLMHDSHDGLQNLYEVSCPELDFLVSFAKESGIVVGSRMMGGGFGGSTINIIHKDHIKDFAENASEAYLKKIKKSLTPIDVTLGDGTH